MELPAQTVSLPLMDAGVDGVARTLTARVSAGESPQAFEAATVTFPPVAPALAWMEFVLELPVQPPGKVQL
jgi:hypothetical protein